MLDSTKLYTAKEFEAAIGLSDRTIDKLRRKKMPYVKLDGKNFWSGKRVMDWLIENYSTDIEREVARQTDTKARKGEARLG